MKPTLLLLLTAPLLLLIASCAGKGSDEPHPATLYDICEVSQADPAAPAILHLYRPDADLPVILTAQPGALGATPPDPGTSILAAYTPDDGRPYTSGPVTLHRWSTINNLPLQEAKDSEELQGWDTDPVWLLSAWRAGNKICMRLRLGYDTSPRRFALLLDPETASDPIPTAYLYHLRPTAAPTFDRQYYVAFDITPLWALPSTQGLRIRLANSASPSLSTLLFQK
jgi:hypothetical protein